MAGAHIFSNQGGGNHRVSIDVQRRLHSAANRDARHRLAAEAHLWWTRGSRGAMKSNEKAAKTLQLMNMVA
jgi:hypothetical protein